MEFITSLVLGLAALLLGLVFIGQGVKALRKMRKG